MVRVRTGMKLAVVSMAVLGLLAGCASNRVARTGSVLGENLRPGQSVPDFSFAGENGKVETFDSVRGVVTLVLFPTAPNWPDCKHCESVARLAGEMGTGTSPVTVVSVVTPREGERAVAALHGCRVRSFSQLIALYDRDRKLQPLFGPDAAGKFFVIDSSGAISATGQIGDHSSIESALESAVAAHEERWQQMFSSNYEG